METLPNARARQQPQGIAALEAARCTAMSLVLCQAALAASPAVLRLRPSDASTGTEFLAISAQVARSTALAYARTITCVEPEELSPAVPLSFKSGRTKFAVIWLGDIGCGGGSGSTTWNITILSGHVNSDAVHVEPSESSPSVTLKLGSFGDFSSPYRITEGPDIGTFSVDGRRCPGRWISDCQEPLRVTFARDDMGNWAPRRIKKLEIVQKKQRLKWDKDPFQKRHAS